ncbi:Uncharacterised protein [Klebsiella pneumoniae]|nr:Uncharacterised protein [Klebsiella pneumoniae]
MHSATVIKNQAGIFPGCSSQSAAQRLQPANFTFCRTGVDNAANITIKTGHQHTHTDDYFCGASLEAVDHRLPFFVGCFCDHHLSVNARLVKLHGYKVCVGLVNAERHRRKVTTMTKPVIDDIAHQVRTAHDFRQLGLVVISTELHRWLRFYPAKIRFCWGEKFVLTEVTTLDQFANRRWLNQVLIVMAQERRKRGTR